jgi:RNA polymerase sigma-70 factor (ECF subfamily)
VSLNAVSKISTVNTDDRRLINECLKGSSAAYGELVYRYQDRLYNSILRVLSDPDDALDVVQESFFSAYQSLNSFKGDSEFFTWLYRIAFNAAISLKRKQRVVYHQDWNGDNLGLEPVDRSAFHDPSSRIERTESEKLLQEALNRLSAEHRTVLVLKDIEGQRYEDIADILDVPVGTIRSRLHRARVELREILEADNRWNS